MNWIGKLIGGALGLLVGGAPGALIGVLLGHLVDAYRRRYAGLAFGRNHRERTQDTFFAATFSVMGCLAKADGRVSEHEIRLAEKVMARLELTPAMRTKAIQFFTAGKQPGFGLDAMLDRLRRECRHNAVLIRIFMEIQIAAVFADGVPKPAERKLLVHICGRLGISERDLARLEQIIGAGQRFSQSYNGTGRRTTPAHAFLDSAYGVLNLTPAASIDEIKKGYRRLMNQHHPDKLVARGMPEEMMKLAAQKTHEIKSAYEQIRRQRGF